MNRRATAFVFAMAALTLFTSAEAQTPAPPSCSLARFASLPMRTAPDGTVSIPVALDGHPVQMEVDTGSIVSSMAMDRAREFGLKMRPAPAILYFMNNVPMALTSMLETVQLEQATAHDVMFYLSPPRLFSPDVSGLFGPDFMRNYDVDFDFAGGNFSLFMPNTCAAAPVYWTREPYAELPLAVAHNGHISAHATLDGAALDVEIDTGSPRSTMGLGQAKDIFGWRDDDPRLVKRRSERMNGGAEIPVYHYPFAALTFEGIQVNNPDIDLVPDKSLGRGSPAIIGMSILRQLHVYIGYTAGKLYLTAAEAPK
jgi:predicted aspartyl protease